ncbi:hypothetical protein YC2023_068781 [Brassica napus]
MIDYSFELKTITTENIKLKVVAAIDSLVPLETESIMPYNIRRLVLFFLVGAKQTGLNTWKQKQIVDETRLVLVLKQLKTIEVDHLDPCWLIFGTEQYVVPSKISPN